MSAGLEYVPGRWSTTDEVAELAEELVAYDAVYISHERSEGADPMWYWPSQDEPGPPTLQDAIMETIEIGRRSEGEVDASAGDESFEPGRGVVRDDLAVVEDGDANPVVREMAAAVHVHDRHLGDFARDGQGRVGSKAVDVRFRTSFLAACPRIRRSRWWPRRPAVGRTLRGCLKGR